MRAEPALTGETAGVSEFATFDVAFAWLASHTNYEKQTSVL